MNRTVPTRALRENPDLDQLKRQAKELLDAFRAGEESAVAEVAAHYRNPGTTPFALHDAQLVLARSYGFESWPKLKARVDGVTVARLAQAVQSNDLAAVRALLQRRPELVHMERAENDEHRALHYAVLNRSPEMARLLMEHGADPNQGIWPHRRATTPLQIALDRGFDEIVGILRRPAPPPSGSEAPSTEVSEKVQAVLSGDAAWLRARHAEGRLADPPVTAFSFWRGGLLTTAVVSGRPEILALLLELGFDPDERVRFPDLDDSLYSWGLPLWQCADNDKVDMAKKLLERGADPNGEVYAWGSALYRAYYRHNQELIALLESHGGKLDAASAGFLCQTELARRILAEDPAQAATLLWSGAGGGDPEIVRMALPHIDWPRDDPNWMWPMWQSLYSGGDDCRRGLACLRLLLERADANLSRFGRTTLHDAIAAHENAPPEARREFVTALLDAGARLDLRDDLLKSTPLGWACRWGRVELVQLLLERGADPVEADAEPWATPKAWATKMKHDAVLKLLG